MFNSKLLASILLVLAVMFAQVGNVAAAPQTQDGTTTTITGTIQDITTELDANGETVVVVKLLDDQDTTQIVTLSAQEAADNNLFDLTTGELLAQKDDSVELVVDPNDVVAEEEPTEPDVHPISALLASFFFDSDPEMASLIDSFHTGDNDAGQVFGFGVIAQALWMSKTLNYGTADAELAGLILEAKKSGNYEEFSQYFDEGTVVPTNWGQFKKLLHEKKQNLGVIVSGQEDNGTQDPALQQDNKDHGKNNKEKHNHGRGNNKKNKNP